MKTAKKTAKIAIGYVRVSTARQADEGVSLDAQRAKIAAYCDLHGLELGIIHADEGISGGRADNRPGLQRALTDVCKRKGVLVTYSLSRFARSTRDCIDLIERIEQCGADFASITESINTASGIGRFFFRLMASLGELERDQVSERTSAALGHLRRQSRRTGTIPYGFDLADDGEKLVQNAAEYTVLARIQAMDEAGDSLNAIARTLNAENIPPKSGVRWYASSVRSVLARVEALA